MLHPPLYPTITGDEEETKETGNPFNFIVIPDTQYLASRWHPEAWRPHYHTLCDWIVNNKNSLNIKAVLHVGDIVNTGVTEEYDWATAAIKKITDADIPFFPALGNHDFDYYTNGFANRDTEYFNDYFGYLKEKEYFKGTYDGEIENAYYELEINGDMYLFLVLEYGVRDEVIQWADGVLSEYADHHVFVNIHSYMFLDGTRTGPGDRGNPREYHGDNFQDANDGEDLWVKLIKKHRNIRAIYSGHHHPEIEKADRRQPSIYNASDKIETYNGNIYAQHYQNWQYVGAGGEGRVRIVTINKTLNTIKTITYSPVLKKYETLPGYITKNRFIY